MSLKGIEEPRIYTPPLRDLTPDTSLGYEIIDFSENYLKVALLPWEKWFLIHAFEVTDDDEDGWRFRFRIILLLVARQSGKTTVGCIVVLYFLYALEVGLVLGTSKDI